MAEKTRTLLFGLFVLARRPLNAAQCVGLASALGVTRSNVKSHLTRLVADGALTRRGGPRDGLYSITDDKRLTVEAIENRLNAPPADDWTGNWLMLCAPLPSSRSERDRMVAALWFDGWRCMRGGAFVRPDWPAAWSRASAVSHLRDGGLWIAGALSGATHEDIAAVYELDRLDAEAAALARDLARRTQVKTPRAAFRNRIEAGGAVARFLSHDPRLPNAVWGRRAGPRSVAAAWRAFEEANRHLSDKFMSEILENADGDEDRP